MNKARWHYFSKLSFLVVIAIILAARAVWLFLADNARFPIHTVQIEASYQHLSHQDIKNQLSPYLDYSFFTIPASRLRHALLSLPWVAQAQVEREWPDQLHLILVEKKAFARWNQQLMTAKGECFPADNSAGYMTLPQLKGPPHAAQKVLAKYKNLSKILSAYRLSASIVVLRENGAWELGLNNQLLIFLGKKEVEKKLTRFIRAWPALMETHHTVPRSVDLRYPQGMAVDWASANET